MQPSRRAFLLGRRPAQTPWARFMQRLTLLCQGPCATWARPARTARAAGWRPRARATWPTPGRCAPSTAWPWRWTARRNRRWSLPAGGSREPQRPGPPGRRHAALAGPARRAAGGAGASRPAAVRRPARRHDAGRMAGGASRLAGGTLRAVRGPGGRRGAGRRGGGNLGAFGESDERPLRSATLQRLVPALFQLSTGPDAAACAVGGAWAGRYRLDALRPQAPATVNLAHLLLGHGGTLAWVQEVLLTAVPAAEGGRRRGAVVGRCGAGGGTPARRPDQGAVRPGWSFSLTRFFAIATVRGPRVRWAGPAGAGRRTGAARARSHIAPAAVGINFSLSCTSTSFSPIPWMPIFAKPPSNITSSGAPAKSPSPHQAADQPARPGAGLLARVAAACEEIVADPANVFRYTARGNLVGVITNGTAVLGLGNIGALASSR